MAANWSSLTIDPRHLDRNQMITPAFDQSASFQTNQSQYPNTPHSSFSSWPKAADVQASRMPSALAGPNMDLGPSAIDMSLDPIEFEFNDVMGAQVDTHRGWSGQADYETTHFQQQNSGQSFQYPLPSFVFPPYEHDPNQGPQELKRDSQGLIISQPPAKSPPRHQMGCSVPPPTGHKMQQEPATSSTGISVRSSEKRLSRATIDRKLKSRRRPMAQKRVPPAHGTAQGKHTKPDGVSSQSTTSSSECSTNVEGLKTHTPKFQEVIAMVQESIKPFSPPFRRKAAALIDQVAELVKQLNQVAIDEELYGNAPSDVEVDTQPSVASSSDDYISNPELTDSESNTDNTSVSSTPRQLFVENETPAFAEDDQQGSIHPPCAQCGVKTLYFCTRQDKKTKKPCRYAHHVLAEWKRHMKTQKHSQRERFMCPECPNSPPAIDINGHSVCQFCEESFPALGANLRAHYTQCQSAQRSNKSYGRQDKLIDHLRSHPGVINLSLTAAAGRYTVNSEWPDECGFCGKMFSSFDEMLDDIAKHFQAGLNMSSWKLPIQPSKDSHPGFQPHSKGDDSDSDDDMDDNDSYPSNQSSGGQTKEASNFSSSGQRKRSNGNQKSGSSYQGGRRRCYLVPQATLDNSAESIESHASGHATTSVALERYLNNEEEPVELRLSQISSGISNSSLMFSAVATEDDFVSNVPDPEYVTHSLTLQEHKGCFKETITYTRSLQVPSIGFSGFGSGIGESFALGQLALDAYKSCETASEDLKALSTDSLSSLEILQALRVLQFDHSLPERNQGILPNLLSTCRDVLQDVQAQVEKRKSFKSDRKRMLLFDRFKWSKYDIDVLTTHLTRNRAMFEIFLMAASPSGGLQSALTLLKLRQTTCQGACMSKDSTGEYGVTNHISEVFTGNGNETHPGLIVTDSAVIPTALGVNLFATINALGELSVKYTAKCRIFQNINMEPNDVLELFDSPHQVNSDKQILHRRDTYRISEAKDLIRATRAAKPNGFNLSEVMSGYIHVSSCLEVPQIEDYHNAQLDSYPTLAAFHVSDAYNSTETSVHENRSDWSQVTETENDWVRNNRGQVFINTVTKEQDESIENSATSRDSRYGTPRVPIPRSPDRTNGEVPFDNSYKVRSHDYGQWFKPGRVFRMLWADPFGGATKKHDAQSLDRAFVVQSGQNAYYEIWRFIVVRSGDRFTTCLPVTTYGGSGVTKRGVKVRTIVCYSCDRRAHDLSGVGLQQPRSTPSNRRRRKLETPRYIQGREEEHDGPSNSMKARTRILGNQGWPVPFIDYLSVYIPPLYILHIPEARLKHAFILSSIQDTGKQHIGLDDQELTNSNNPEDQNEPHEYYEFHCLICIGSLDDLSRACLDCPLEFVSFTAAFSEYLQPLLSHH